MAPAGRAVWAAALLAAIVLTGCAGTPANLDPALSTLPRRVELREVPHHAQLDYHCGPAALASALNAAGITATPEHLAALVYTGTRKGSLPLDMLGGARRSGALAVRIPPSRAALLAEVAAGRPVIVLQNLSLPIYPVWHYAVVVGYDLDRRELVLRSGREPRQVLALRTFEHTWARGERWAMIALSPGALPLDSDPQPYLEAALALERLGQASAARHAYEGGLTRWPASLPLLMGAGNTAHALGDATAAERHYRLALRAHPDAAPALNNLAHLLAERDALAEALDLAERAAAVAGPHRAAAQATLSQIRQRLAQEGAPAR